ncbi:MAG: NAD(P)/FAD-dependent oxidoreductase [Candidatus Lokiarchaeota archaeon]|nr:NAD(P)/FAD-dependent oxidoreductase [Candidatus Lokiarchaeota archaeon]
MTEDVIWDCIISGAGPGGSMAAFILAKAGKKVLILERKKIPRHKTCSGILSHQTLKILKKEFNETFPEVLCAWPKKGRGQKIKLPQYENFISQDSEYMNVWRRDFDYWLNIKASEKGVEIWNQAELLSFEEKTDYIDVKIRYFDYKSKKSNFKNIKSKVLIGADGGNSKVKKILYSNEKWTYAYVYQEYWTGSSGSLDPNYFYGFVFPNDVLYKSWNQKEDQMIIGASHSDPHKVKENHAKFVEYLEERFGMQLEKKVRAEGCYQSNVDSFGGSEYKLGKGKVLLIGEAAGLMDIFGEGIPAALTSGKEAALSIIESENENYINLYQEKLKKYIHKLIRNWNNLKKMGNFTFQV